MNHYNRIIIALLTSLCASAYAQMPPSGYLSPRAVGNINQQIAQNKAQSVTLPGAPIVDIPAPPKQNTQPPVAPQPATPNSPPPSNTASAPIIQAPSAPVGNNNPPPAPAVNNPVIYSNPNELRADYYREQNAKNEAQFGAKYHNLNSIHPSNFPKNQPALGFAISERQKVVAHIRKAKSFGISEGKIELELKTRSVPNFIAWVDRVTGPMN